jgi:hypothetical protein
MMNVVAAARAEAAAIVTRLQAACEAGCKPQLPWNVPAPFNISHEQRRVQTLLNRYALLAVSVSEHIAGTGGMMWLPGQRLQGLHKQHA